MEGCDISRVKLNPMELMIRNTCRYAVSLLSIEYFDENNQKDIKMFRHLGNLRHFPRCFVQFNFLRIKLTAYNFKNLISGDAPSSLSVIIN